jgi:hypothetical protein
MGIHQMLLVGDVSVTPGDPPLSGNTSFPTSISLTSYDVQMDNYAYQWWIGANALIYLENDGRALYRDITQYVDGDWFTPRTPFIGSGWWIRLTKTSGDNILTSPSANTWIKLDSECIISFEKVYSDPTKSAVYSLEFATDSAGSNIVRTSTITVTLTYATTPVAENPYP